MHALYRDRREAGRRLAERVRPLAGNSPALVLALTPGGVQVAIEVAEALRAPLDVFVVRKLPVPGHEGLALGAVATGGMRVLDDSIIAKHRVRGDALREISLRERRELERLEREYRQDRPYPKMRDVVVVVVDDGVVSGETMYCAVEAIRRHRPAGIIAAAPVMSRRGAAALSRLASACVALVEHTPVLDIDAYYADARTPSEARVRELLAEAASARRGRRLAPAPEPDDSNAGGGPSGSVARSRPARPTYQRRSGECPV